MEVFRRKDCRRERETRRTTDDSAEWTATAVQVEALPDTDHQLLTREDQQRAGNSETSTLKVLLEPVTIAGTLEVTRSIRSNAVDL